MSTPSLPGEIAYVFETYPEAAQAQLMDVRALLFAEAENAGTAPLVESPKWGQPSYAPQKARVGSPVRLGLTADKATVFFNCNSTLVQGFRRDFDGVFDYSGNRALHLGAAPDHDALSICLRRALTYHLAKKTPA